MCEYYTRAEVDASITRDIKAKFEEAQVKIEENLLPTGKPLSTEDLMEISDLLNQILNRWYY